MDQMALHGSRTLQFSKMVWSVVLYAQPEYVYVELEAFRRGEVKKECERFKVYISLWEPPDVGLFLLCQSMHSSCLGHTGSFRGPVTCIGELKGSKVAFQFPKPEYFSF